MTNKIEFSTYLNDSDMSFYVGNYLDSDWAKLSKEDRAKYEAKRDELKAHFNENRKKTFYEIELRCTLDLDTYEIEILRLVQ